MVRNPLYFLQSGGSLETLESRISEFSRISRKWTFLKRPPFQKTHPLSEPDIFDSLMRLLFLSATRENRSSHRRADSRVRLQRLVTFMKLECCCRKVQHLDIRNSQEAMIIASVYFCDFGCSWREAPPFLLWTDSRIGHSGLVCLDGL